MATGDKVVSLDGLKTAYDNTKAMIASTEASSTASTAHVPGTNTECFIYGGTLYRATADIAQGGTIVPSGAGKNCEAVTVGGELAALNAAVDGLEDDADALTADVLALETGKAPVIVDTATGDPASFPDAIGGVPLVNVTAEITPVQNLHGYDHAWPAGGGPNIWDEDWESGMWTSEGAKNDNSLCIRCKNYIPVMPGDSYYVKTTNQLIVRQLDANKAVLSTSSHVKDQAITASENTYYLVFNTRAEDAIITYGDDISINSPATVTGYFPYANICPITGGRTMWSLAVAPNPDGTGGSMIGGFFPMVQFEQVTVYGGALNMTTGELSSTHGFVEDLGDLEWTYDAEGGYFTSTGVAATAKANSDKGFCSILPVGSTLTGDRIYVGADGAIIAYYANASTAAEFAQAMDGQQFVYELAQGTTYNLTPTEIAALAGQNYVWAGTGDVTVQYRADTKGYVDKKIAELAALILENI